jgi:serine protease Do
VNTTFIAGDLADALTLPNRGGLLVQTVESGSSAEAAGIRGARQVVIIGNMEVGVGGDFIMGIDGQAIDREDALIRIMAHKRVGDTVTLSIFRNNRNIQLPVKLLRPPQDLQ